MTYQERLVLTQAKITLNGEQAVICGAREEYAIVASLESPAWGNWSWPGVQRIVTNGGGFSL